MPNHYYARVVPIAGISHRQLQQIGFDELFFGCNRVQAIFRVEVEQSGESAVEEIEISFPKLKIGFVLVESGCDQSNECNSDGVVVPIPRFLSQPASDALKE